MLEHLVDRGHPERQDGRAAGAAGVVDAAAADADLRLERRIAAEQHRVVQRDAVVEHAGAGADDRLLVDRIRHAEARFEHVLVRLGEAARRAD